MNADRILCDQLVAGVEVLIPQQNFVNIERVGFIAGDRMTQHLKDVFDALRVVNIGVHDEFKRSRFVEKCELQSPVEIGGLETVNQHITGSRSMQDTIDFVKEIRGHTVLYLITQCRLSNGEEPVATHSRQ